MEDLGLEVFHEFIQWMDHRIARLLCQMRVDLSCPRAAVPEALLNDAEVHAHFQQMRGVRVPERMNMSAFWRCRRARGGA